MKVLLKFINKNEYSHFIGSSEIDDIVCLSKIYFINLVKIQDFLEGKLKIYQPVGKNIWGDNWVAIKTFYEETKSIYIKDNGYLNFCSVFLTNNYEGLNEKRLNLINTTQPNFSYLLNEIKPFFHKTTQENYNSWVSSNFTFKGK